MEQTIRGHQDAGVQATAKHYIGNEQETQRNPNYNYNATLNTVVQEAISSNIDDRTMHELYLWPFANSVKAGASSFMCAYQRLNGSYACENSKAQNGILKEELGFQGYVSPAGSSSSMIKLTSFRSCPTGVARTAVWPLLSLDWT